MTNRFAPRLGSRRPPARCVGVAALVLLCAHACLRPAGCQEPVHTASLIASSERMERALIDEGMILAGDSLNVYVNGVAAGLLPPGENAGTHVTVRVLIDRSINAFATPHGTIYVCAGLLARMTNEAQLAALLGHEMTHIINNHAVRDLVNAKKSAKSSAEAQIGLQILIGDISSIITGAALRSAVTGYSRDLEREADSAGLIRMRKAGYAPLEFRNLFMLLKACIESEKIKEPFFFSTHPRIAERIHNYYQMAGTDTAAAGRGITNAGVFAAKVRGVVLVDASVNCAVGKFGLARAEARRLLAADSCNAEALVLMGDIERLGRGDSSRVMPWYRRAAACAPSEAMAIERMGLAAFAARDRAAARPLLRRYLAEAAHAPDSSLVKEYVRQCDR